MDLQSAWLFAVTGLWLLGCSSPSLSQKRPVQRRENPREEPREEHLESSPSRSSSETEAPPSVAPRGADEIGATTPVAPPDTGTAAITASQKTYPWLDGPTEETLARRFAPPTGYHRPEVEPSSFARWLRGLPLLPGRPEVLLFNGEKKGNQDAHEAVVNIDVGTRDLQQCADAVMRLRAEYLRSVNRDEAICFRFTNGSDAVWTRWRDGERPKTAGRRTVWKRTARPDATYDGFRRYLVKVFQYAGTASLEREMPVVDPEDRVQAGDVFIKGGFPGHAVLVVDVAESRSGERVFLLVQSYMPAQQMHVLKNPAEPSLSPWYRERQGEPLWTPEWRFPKKALRRFSDRRCDH